MSGCPMLVAINGPGNPGAFHLAAKQAKVSGTVFMLGLELGRTYLIRGIVDRAKQGQVRSAPFQPIVTATIDLQKHTFLGTALPA